MFGTEKLILENMTQIIREFTIKCYRNRYYPCKLYLFFNNSVFNNIFNYFFIIFV